MENCKVIVGIDVSSKDSTVCVLMDKVRQGKTFKISNDMVGFQQLYKRLRLYSVIPLIVFESTGVYSLSLQAFLEKKHIQYLKLNPLKAKKLMDNNLRHNKTDQVDAYRLALIQFNAPQKLLKPQSRAYHEMQNASRYYEELNKAMVVAKNQLHRNLQTTFPQIENLMCHPTGKIYWSVVALFPHAQAVLDSNKEHILGELETISGLSQKKAEYLTQRLISLARLTCAYDNKDSIVIRAIQRNIASLFSLDQEKKEALAYLYKLASKNQADTRILTIYQSIPGIAKTTALRLLAELGDLRRFDSPNQIDAFIGIDPGIYQSGELDSHLSITKHGNSIARKIMYLSIGQTESVKTTQPCHITDYYDRKKSSQSRGFKKIAIASVHKLIRTMYALVTKNQLYDYNVATRNQRL